MKNHYPIKAIWFVALFTLFFCPNAKTQTVVFEETFNNPPPFLPQNWTWSPNGTAENGDFWDNRPAIFSASGGGALMVNGDSLAQISFDPVNAFLNFNISLPDISPTSKYFLRFNQYFRNFQSATAIEAFVDTDNDMIGDTWIEVYNNDNIGKNVETSHKDVVVLDVTDLLTGEGLFLQFIFAGKYYFWIIDDVQLIEDNNPYPPEVLWGHIPGQGDFNGGMNGWTTQGIGNPDALWVWESDGKADQGAFAAGFGDIPIHSPTLSNGAMLFDSDYYDNGGNDQNIGNGPVPATQVSELISPVIDLTGMPMSSLILSFNQYFRQQNSTTSVAYSSDGGNNWSTPIPFNQDVPAEEATPSTETISIPLMGAAPTNQFRIKFIINADYYFWVIDDVKLGVNTLYPETFPPYIGDSLSVYGIPYDVDCDKGPYVPNQLIVQFSPGTSPVYKDSIRNSFGVAHVDTCMCSVVELWHFGPDTSSTPGLSAGGPSAGINEKKASAKGTPMIDGVDFNRFVWNELQGAPPPVFSKLETIPNIPGGPADVLIAILDTGLDFDHPALGAYIYKNTAETLDSLDEDGSCLIDDVVGYNFVRDNNNVQDDHSHGTHLAGILKDNLENNASCANYKLLPVKTHNEHGVAELFNILCGFYYALRQGADVINCSWGWYDNNSDILDNFLDSARVNYNTLAIAAAGNDTINLQEHPQFPACDTMDNIISVGAFNMAGSDINFSGFSNFSPICVDIAAPGDSIMSTVPNGGLGFKSGTSMAAPAVAAAAAKIYCQGNVNSYLEVRNCLLDNAIVVDDLLNFVMGGHTLNFNLPCIVSVNNVPEAAKNITVFPNPTSGQLSVTPDFDLKNAKIMVYDAVGRQLVFRHIDQLMTGDILELDIGNYPPGMYLVAVQAEGEIRSTKVVKF